MKTWWQRSLETTVTGTLFGLIISVLLASLSWHPAVRFLSQWGADSGQRLAELVNRSTVPAFDQDEIRFTFIDFDFAGCLALTSDTWRCADVGNPDLEVLGALIASLAAGGAQMAVLDFQLTRAELASTLGTAGVIGGERPRSLPLIVPVYARPSVERRHMLSSEPQLGEASNVYRAAFAVWSDGHVGDGTIRNYPATVWLDHRDQGAFELIPSAPLLISLLNDRAPATLARCMFAEIRDCDLGQGTSRVGETARRLLRDTPSSSTDVILSEYDSGAITFGIPNWFRATSANQYVADTDIADRYDSVLRVMALTDILEPTSPTGIWTPESISGTTVVIGSLSTAANDIHRTPLGVMHGWQLLLNAASSFHTDDPIPARHGPGIVSEVAIVFVTALVLLVFELVREWVRDKLAVRGRMKMRNRMLRLGASGVIFVAMLVSAAWVSIFIQWGGYFLTAGSPAAVDFLLPMIAVLLASFVEVSEAILRPVRKVASWIVAHGVRSNEKK